MRSRKVGWNILGYSGLESGKVVGSHEYGNEPAGAMQCIEFLD